MENDPLAPLFAPLTSLRGVGESISKLIARAAGGDRVIDLLYHLPESFIDRRERVTIRETLPGRVVTWAVEVVRIEPPGNARQPTRAVVTDGSAFAELVFFRQFPAARLPVGAKVLVSGKADERSQMIHPDHIAPAGRPDGLPPVEPVWPLTAGLFPWHLRRPLAEAVGRIHAARMAGYGADAARSLARLRHWPDCTPRRSPLPRRCAGGGL